MDKDRDTFFNGYTENKFKGVCRELWAKGAALSLKCYFYILVNILLDYYMLTYNSNRYFIKISDLFTFKFKSKSPIRCMPLIFTIYIGKQN